ncbi:MAG: hypothetical protein IJR02_08825 [Bacteroidaceae bacterium]|nr:hypothetical protein [Bacteroidaceae bacterium]
MKKIYKMLVLSLLSAVAGGSAWADNINANLERTAGIQWGSNTGAATVDAAFEYYNNDASNAWSGCAYAKFTYTIPDGHKITSATLTYSKHQNHDSTYDDKIYYMNGGFDLSREGYGTNWQYLAGVTGTDLRFTDKRTYLTTTPKHQGNQDHIGLTVDVTNAVAAMLAEGQNYVIFQWTGNSGSANLYGRVSSNHPTLEIVTEKISVDSDSNTPTPPTSPTFILKAGETREYSFYNYSNGKDTKNNWILYAQNGGTNVLTLYADGTATGSTTANAYTNYKGNDGTYKTTIWNYFMSDMAGLSPRVNVKTYFTGTKLYVYSKAVCTNGAVYYVNSVTDVTAEELSLYFGAQNATLNFTTSAATYSDFQFWTKQKVLGENETSVNWTVNGAKGYSMEIKGDLTATFNHTTGAEVKNIAGDGGAIVVTAYYNNGENDTYKEAYYVITKPYKTHTWNFYSSNNTDGTGVENKGELFANTDNWGLTWKVRQFDKTVTPNEIQYIDNAVYASTVKVDGDNARFIDNTAGLLVTTSDYADSKGKYGFGTNITYEDLLTSTVDKPNSAKMDAYTLDDVTDPCTYLTLKNGSTLTIPNLKAGQYVRFRWNRYSPGVGDRMIAYNVTDLEGTDMNGKYFYLGSGSNEKSSMAHQEFIVKSDGNVSFYLEQEGWMNIYDIVVADQFIPTHLTIGGETRYLRKRGGDVIEAPYTTHRGTIHMQSSLDPSFKVIETTASLTPNTPTVAYWENRQVGNSSVPFYKLTVPSNSDGAHGRFTLVMEGRQNVVDRYVERDYMLDSVHTVIKVYEYDYDVKPYPYTWAMERFTEDTGNHTLSEIAEDANTQGNARTNYHYWDNGNDNKKIFRIGYPENLIAWMKKAGTPQWQSAVKYAMTAGEKLVSGQTVSVRNTNKESVATVTFGERVNNTFGNGPVFKAAVADGAVSGYTAYTPGNEVNGNNAGGTFYTIIPKYDGQIEVAVSLNSGKQFYILENGTALSNFNGITESDKKIGTYTFNVRAGQHYKIYASGSKLGFYGFNYTYQSGGEVAVPEFDGLGIMPAEYWNEEDKGLQLESSVDGLIFGNKVYKLTVPSVKLGQTVYLAVTDDTDNSSVSVGSASNHLSRSNQGSVFYDPLGSYVDNNKVNVYKIDGANADVDIYLTNVKLHKVAVSVDTKTVSAAGYATEAREYPLDFTLAKTFLGEEQKAFKVTGVDETNVAVAEVKYVPMTIDGSASLNHGVMITGDWVNRSQATQWPLFTTDIDRATYDVTTSSDAKYDMSENKLIGVVAQANVDANVEQRKIVNGEKYYNYMLAVNGYNVEYPGDSEETIGEVVDRVSGLGYYLVLKTGTTMLDGTTYPGGKPKDHSAYMHVHEKFAKINEFQTNARQRRAYPNANGVHQVFFIDANGLASGIDELQMEDAAAEEGLSNGWKDGVFYTLQGMPVKNPTKGFYIFNGKKIYVK